MKRARLISLISYLAIQTGCVGPHKPADVGAARPRLFDGMGSHQRIVSTSSPEAQKFFNQGLIWAFAFNHDEAIRSFGEAARLDPNCAMAFWGIALCNGPHINNPIMSPDRSKAAWESLLKAQALAQHATPTEQALIAALAKRYSDSPPADRKPLDVAYAEAMRDVSSAHPDDADIATLFAESMMDLRPWDLWTHDGQPQPGTPEIVAALERAMALNPNHPGANHLYIHAIEASPRSKDALTSADRLRTLVPASGHLTHMPSHIDVRVGNWTQAADQNARAIEVDRAYRALSPKQGFYRIYMAHNHHFLSWAGMMEGNSAVSLRAARDMIAGIPEEALREQTEFIDPVMAIAMEAQMRFGQWDQILREPKPAANLVITTALFHYARGIAYAARGQPDSAEYEQKEFEFAAKRVPDNALMAINPAKKVLAIARHMLAGEIAYRRGQIDIAISEFRYAVRIEDDLLYMEPPDWIQPVRHTLGAVLVGAKRYEEAEAVYRDDLRHWPENGWSLHGLAAALRGRGATSDADDVEKRFKKAWSRSDVKIGSSCLCVKQ